MGLRFRKSVKIIPGVRVNFGMSGMSLSVGGKGATVTVNKRGARATVGIPGTGLSYSEKLLSFQQPATPKRRKGNIPLRPVQPVQIDAETPFRRPAPPYGLGLKKDPGYDFFSVAAFCSIGFSLALWFIYRALS